MEIKVYLRGNTQAQADISEPVILPENELVLAFESDVYKLTTLLLSVRNDTEGKQYKIKSPFKADIAEFLTPSVIDAEVSLISKGEVVKTWREPSITIKEVKATYELTPEIAELRIADAKQQEAIKELYGLLKNQNLI